MKNNSFWKFIDNSGSFIVKEPQKISFLYFPLFNEAGIMSSITPQLQGDIKIDNNSFLMLPVSHPDLPNTNSSRNFWICLDKSKKVWNLSGNYVTNLKDTVTLEAGFLYHKVIRKNSALGLEAEIINFVPVTENYVELMLIKITNISNQSQEITPTSAIPLFCRSADNLRDHRHVTSLLHRIKQAKFGVIVKPVMSFDERGHKIYPIRNSPSQRMQNFRKYLRNSFEKTLSKQLGISNGVNQTSYFVFGVDSNNNPPIGSFPTQESFTGEGANLNNPLAILNNLAPEKLPYEKLQGKEAIGALRFKTQNLKPKESISFVLILGIAHKDTEISKTLLKFNTINKITNALNENKIFWKNKINPFDKLRINTERSRSINNLSFKTGNFVFDNWLRWVSLQPALRKIYGCSFLPDFDYGKGEKGWRDLWQDCLALLLTDSSNIKPLITANFSGVRIDGTNATIITKTPGKFIADRNKISRVWMDHGIWPLFTLDLYINQTGDLNILLEKTAYFRDAQIMRAKEIDVNWDGFDKLKMLNKEIYQGTILEHILVQHLVQFFNVGKHNCIKLENADWNDGLDMAGDLGESAAFSSFYAFNLNRIAQILEKLKQINKINEVRILKELVILLDTLNKPINYNSVSEKNKLLNKYLESVKFNTSGETEKINIDELIRDLRRKSLWLSNHIRRNEWININKDIGFFNGYYDNLSKRVEGKFNNLVRMTLTGQVFAILSGAATDQQIKKIYNAAKKYLQDKKLKGFRLNTDFKKPQFNLGRAFAFVYGEKENGAIFSHMCAMFAYALYSRGFAKEGFEVLNSLYKMAANSSVSKIYPNLPEYFNLEGRGMYCYLTGSASWFIMTYFREVFGIQSEFGSLKICPKLTKEQFKNSKQLSVEFIFLDKRIKVTYVNSRKLDYPKYSIKQVNPAPRSKEWGITGGGVNADVKFQQINSKEILINRKPLSNFPSNKINIKIILG